jgi:hypothetical protein
MPTFVGVPNDYISNYQTTLWHNPSKSPQETSPIALSHGLAGCAQNLEWWAQRLEISVACHVSRTLEKAVWHQRNGKEEEFTRTYFWAKIAEVGRQAQLTKLLYVQSTPKVCFFSTFTKPAPAMTCPPSMWECNGHSVCVLWLRQEIVKGFWWRNA